MRVALGLIPMLALAAGAAAQTDLGSPSLLIAQDAQPAPAPAASPAGSSVSPTATFLLGNERIHSDPVIGWDGFINGLRGFEHLYNPIGNPLYFETPLNNTGVRFLFIHHSFAEDSVLGGGDVTVYAMQARIALTERLAFIATKDGWSTLDADNLPEDSGWNDIALGGKYAWYVDREADLVSSIGFRWMLNNGDSGILQGDVNEFSPFLSAAKGFGRFHTMANITGRIPTDDDDGNSILQWDVHFDYEIWPEVLKGFAPIFEVHGLHYLSDGERTPLDVGGADYANLGSTDVDGSTVVWGSFGARWKLSPHMSIGGAYEQSFTNVNADIFDNRVTIDLELTW
ncbi:MAG: hypothetical protein SFZ24_10540 [Planctomycetota bacterium]|nr:hypothetical protein [Planctomycetota bacterium]